MKNFGLIFILLLIAGCSTQTAPVKVDTSVVDDISKEMAIEYLNTLPVGEYTRCEYYNDGIGSWRGNSWDGSNPGSVKDPYENYDIEIEKYNNSDAHYIRLSASSIGGCMVLHTGSYKMAAKAMTALKSLGLNTSKVESDE